MATWSACSLFEDAFAGHGYQGPKLLKPLATVLPHLDIEIVQTFRSGQRIGSCPNAGSSSAPLRGSIAAEG